MLINLTELFSREGKEKTYTCSIDMDTLTTTKEAFPIVSKGLYPYGFKISATESFS